jgi:hypothetical protein
MLLINIYKAQYKYFKSGVIYVQNGRVCEHMGHLKTLNYLSKIKNQKIIFKNLLLEYIFNYLINSRYHSIKSYIQVNLCLWCCFV